MERPARIVRRDGRTKHRHRRGFAARRKNRVLTCHPQKEMAAIHIRSIIVPPAGPRTRLLPATKVVPKELLNVYDRPVLQFAIDEAIDAGAERIIVVIHQSKLAIRDYPSPTVLISTQK